MWDGVALGFALFGLFAVIAGVAIVAVIIWAIWTTARNRNAAGEPPRRPDRLD